MSRRYHSLELGVAAVRAPVLDLVEHALRDGRQVLLAHLLINRVVDWLDFLNEL